MNSNGLSQLFQYEQQYPSVYTHNSLEGASEFSEVLLRMVQYILLLLQQHLSSSWQFLLSDEGLLKYRQTYPNQLGILGNHSL